MYRPTRRGLPATAAAPSLLLALALALAAMPALANQTLRYNIADGADGADDAEEAAGTVDLTSSDLEIVEDEPGVGQSVGLRFQGVDIPQGLPVLGAYIQFATDENDKSSASFQVRIDGEASADAAAYSETPGNISGRPRTAAFVAWTEAPPWTVEHEAGEAQRTPDLTAIVQEIVDQPDWRAGNAMAFVIEGLGTRSAESYEGSIGDVEVADLAPQLVLLVPSTETYRVAASNDDAEEGDDGPGSMDIDSSDLELVEDHIGTPQTIGIRLTDVAIPVGAEIISAHLQFAVDEGDKNADPFDVTIWGEAADSPTAYSETDIISTRAKTAASVRWHDIPFWPMELEGQPGGADQRTPDLTAIVQEIVDRPGWQEGNPMAFIIAGTGQRTAESRDGDGALAPALVVTFRGEQSTPSSYRVRLTWGAGDDPTTQMNVIWDQVRGSGARVLYDLHDPGTECPADPAAYGNAQLPERIDPYRGMNNHIATLRNLLPDTAYSFVIIDDDGATTDCMWFRTAPAVPRAFTYITGGDTKSSGNALQAGRWSNRMVAKLRPLFVLFTGDFNSGDGTDDASWQQWLSDWSDGTKSSDGRMYPIIAVHGNHEDGDMEMLHRLFDSGNADPQQPADYSYGSLTFAGGLLHLINLNSQLYLQGLRDAHDRMTVWLGEDLAAHQGDTFKIAGYHKPIRPHTSSKAENDHELAWADLFDTYGGCSSSEAA